MKSLSALKRVYATFINAAKKILKRRGASNYPGRMPYSTANQPPPILPILHISTALYCIPIVGVE